eukprot:TRINITY_DN19481_c0_g1_i5.p1 TRINITY_DN19481_c0_g1~~TRINITY_DN19481_c0_g1_i5.p1  ORF type:complete len:672 (+),score=153.23 TRINITY_DN19481_c0_g1_i5:152-2017(+)
MRVHEEDAPKAAKVARFSASAKEVGTFLRDEDFATLTIDTEFMESSESVCYPDSANRPSFRRSETAYSSLKDFVVTRPNHIEIEELASLKAKLSKQHYAIDIDTFYWETGWAQRIARSWRFHQVMLAWIVAYSIWIAVDADYNTQDDGSPSTLFVVVDNVFCAVFTLEWLIRFAAFKRKADIKHDSWFMFDTLLVALGIMDTWVLEAILHFSVAGNYEFRLLRLLRLTRLTRTVRLLRMVPELLIMLKGMLAATRSMCFCGVLILAIVYVFGIAMKHSAAGSVGGDKYFSSVAQSMYSLLMYATLLDGPSVVLSQLNTLACVVFIFVIGLSALMLMNLLIGVLCEVVTKVSETETYMADESFVRGKLIHILTDCEVDSNRDGRISKSELLEIVKNEAAVKALAEMGCDVMELVLSADMIFQDGEGNDKILEFEEFLKVVMDLRGGNSVTLKDLVGLRNYIHSLVDAVQKNMERLEERLRRMRKMPWNTPTHSLTSLAFRSEDSFDMAKASSREDLQYGSSTVELSDFKDQKASADPRQSALLEAAAAASRQQAALLQAAEVAAEQQAVVSHQHTVLLQAAEAVAEQHRALLQAAEESSIEQRKFLQLREQHVLAADRLIGQ